MMDETTRDNDQRRAEREELLQQRLHGIATNIWWPQDVAKQLGRHVIGQEVAVKRMAVLYRQHIRRMQEAIRDETVLDHPQHHDESGPLLLIGASGVGKSLLIRSMARMAGLPCCVEDCSSQSSTGYIGRSVYDIIAQLMFRADAQIGFARWGVLGLDEFDKIRQRQSNSGVDVSGAGVQRSLLSLLDGGEVQFEWPPGARERVWYPFATVNLLIILAGAFQGLEEVVLERIGERRRRIGFESTRADDCPDRSEILSQVTPEDLIQYGFLPEVVGRIRDVVVMRELDAHDLKRILLEAPDGPLESFQRVARRERFEFALSGPLADAIVEEAISRGLGARSLYTTLARITARALFEVPVMRAGRTGLHTVKLGVAALDDGRYELRPPPPDDDDEGDGRAHGT